MTLLEGGFTFKTFARLHRPMLLMLWKTSEAPGLTRIQLSEPLKSNKNVWGGVVFAWNSICEVPAHSLRKDGTRCRRVVLDLRSGFKSRGTA